VAQEKKGKKKKTGGDTRIAQKGGGERRQEQINRIGKGGGGVPKKNYFNKWYQIEGVSLLSSWGLNTGGKRETRLWGQGGGVESLGVSQITERGL